MRCALPESLQFHGRSVPIGDAWYRGAQTSNATGFYFANANWAATGARVRVSATQAANGFQTFRHVVLPNIATALLAGGMLAFALSFDEVIVTTFTAGQQQTLPIWMLGELLRPR